MDLYTLEVTQFEVIDTRAKVDDTLWLGYFAFVDNDLVAQSTFRLGDFDNGVFETASHDPSDPPGLARVVMNDPTSKVSFIFQLVNSGNVPADMMGGHLTVTASQLAGQSPYLAGAGSVVGDVIGGTNFWVALGKAAFSTFYSWLTVDCDGPIAIDRVSGPRYVIDAWTDTATRSVDFERDYAGAPAPFGCNTSYYSLEWSLRHARAWVRAGGLASELGVSAAAHNGAVHAFGTGIHSPVPVTHTRTFTGASWATDVVGEFDLASTGPPEGVASLPVSAVSYDDRLYIFGVLKDNSIQTLAYTVDGNSWVQQTTGPTGLRTLEPIATAAFQHRLYLLARDSASNHLRMTSTADLETFSPWVDISEPGGFPAESSVAVAVSGESFHAVQTLHIFGVYQNPKDKNHGTVIMHNATSDGSAWTGWNIVEGGAPPEDASAEPLDVAAGIFQERLYLATRWKPTNHIAVNFSEDGANWSGWRVPQYDVDPAVDPADIGFAATAALAAVGNHLYIFATSDGEDETADLGYQHGVWVY
jgi:hypothetical protein